MDSMWMGVLILALEVVEHEYVLVVVERDRRGEKVVG